jgi:hypothetical protein
MLHWIPAFLMLVLSGSVHAETEKLDPWRLPSASHRQGITDSVSQNRLTLVRLLASTDNLRIASALATLFVEDQESNPWVSINENPENPSPSFIEETGNTNAGCQRAHRMRDGPNQR